MPDLSTPPPTRYRVVERKRRLVVIDSATGRPTIAPPPRNAVVEPPARWWPSQTKFDGSATLITSSLYDDKAPRTIRLDPGSAATIGRVKLITAVVAFALVLTAIANFWLLLPLVFIIGNPSPRRKIRAAVTRWLDRIEQEAS